MIEVFCRPHRTQTGADISEVAKVIGMDHRIGNKFLNASVGFGGSCFKKDILNLVYLCQTYGLDEVAAYWHSVVKINEYQQERFTSNILSRMFNTLADKRICLFGFAFKANTSDTRESPAINIARNLLEERAQVIITDPQALSRARQDLAGLAGTVEYIDDPYEAAAGCDAIAVMTEWNLYRDLDYERILKTMNRPAFIFDGRNLLDHQALFEMGFNVFPIGKPALSHY